MDGLGGGGVEDSAADSGGQTAGGDLTAGDGVDHLLFSTLGVLGGQNVHDDAGSGIDGILQGLHGIGLVVLDGDVGAVQAEDLHDDLQTADQLRSHFLTQAVVGGDEGLTLAGVDDDGVHLAEAGGQLHVGGEGCAAHADDTGLTDDGHQIVSAQSVNFFLGAGLNCRIELIQMVILNDNAHAGHAVGVGAGLHSLDRAGHGGVDGDAQTLVVADLLAHQDTVALLDQGLAGCADVLRHGDHQQIRGGESLDFLAFGVVLIFFGVYPSEKGKRHNCHLFHNLQYNYRIV